MSKKLSEGIKEQVLKLSKIFSRQRNFSNREHKIYCQKNRITDIFAIQVGNLATILTSKSLISVIKLNTTNKVIQKNEDGKLSIIPKNITKTISVDSPEALEKLKFMMEQIDNKLLARFKK